VPHRKVVGTRPGDAAKPFGCDEGRRRGHQRLSDAGRREHPHAGDLQVDTGGPAAKFIHRRHLPEREALHPLRRALRERGGHERVDTPEGEVRSFHVERVQQP